MPELRSRSLWPEDSRCREESVWRGAEEELVPADGGPLYAGIDAGTYPCACGGMEVGRCRVLIFGYEVNGVLRQFRGVNKVGGW